MFGLSVRSSEVVTDCFSMASFISRPRIYNLKTAILRARLGTRAALGNETDTPPLPFSAMPGPKPLPLIGNSLELKKNLSRLRFYYQEGFEKYGKIYKVKGMGFYNVLVKDPPTIEKVLRAEGKYPIRDTTFMVNYTWLHNNRVKKPLPLVFQEGEHWKRVRTAIGKQILPKNVQTNHQIYNETIHRFMNSIRSFRNADGTVKDIGDPLRKLVVELTAQTIYDCVWNVVDKSTTEDKQFIDAVSLIFESLLRLAVELPLYKLYNNKLSRDIIAAYKIVENRSKGEVDRICALISAGKESSNPGLLEQWLTEGKLSKEDAIHEASFLFPAGVDTTANQAIFLLHAIAANEEVQEKLYNEIRTVLGENKLPLSQHLSNMPFMKGCLLESYRLCGTAPGTIRVLQEDTILHGYQVPANTTVTYCLYTAGRDSSLFPDPLSFDPGRWERDDMHAFAIQPFGFGPRACYGRRFAELELKLLLIQMVYNFKMSTDIKNLDTVERAVVAPIGDVTIQFADRKH